MPGGTVLISFGPSATEESGALVTGQTGLVSTSHIEAWFQHGDFTTSGPGNGLDEHEEAAALCPLSCVFTGPGTFQIRAAPMAALGLGDFLAHYFWSN